MDLFHNITSRHCVVIYRDLNILSAMDLHYSTLYSTTFKVTCYTQTFVYLKCWCPNASKFFRNRLANLRVVSILFKSCSVTTAHIRAGSLLRGLFMHWTAHRCSCLYREDKLWLCMIHCVFCCLEHSCALYLCFTDV